jgi:hypothetical protein
MTLEEQLVGRTLDGITVDETGWRSAITMRFGDQVVRIVAIWGYESAELCWEISPRPSQPASHLEVS